MTRGAIRVTTAAEAVHRALSQIVAIPEPPDPSVPDSGRRPIAYRLEPGFNGGADPLAAHCASWSYGGRTPTSDCVGLVLWASGVDRLQPGYRGISGEWLHCPSLIDDAERAQRWCSPVDDDKARPGDWLVTGTHIGLIVRPAIYVGGEQRHDHLVVDCSPRHGRAAAINTGRPWSEAARVLRYQHYRAA